MRKEKITYKEIIKKANKKSMTIYLILRILVTICMIRELMLGNLQNTLLCIYSLLLFLLPLIVEKKFKVNLPSTLEIIILLFIFSAEILGEINNFYGKFEHFDAILHTLNGFLAASVGFSLVYLLNENISAFKLSPFFVSLVAFCFSMTIGVVWEFFEYGMDQVFNLDMQKDSYIEKINTVELNEIKSNKVVNIDEIGTVILYDKYNNKITTMNAYLDIGLVDTMEDLIVNFIGAVTFSIFGYFYTKNKEKNKLVDKFIITKHI